MVESVLYNLWCVGFNTWYSLFWWWVGGENIGNTIQGTITDKDYTPIICITVIAGVAVLVAGGVIIAHNVKKDK